MLTKPIIGITGNEREMSDIPGYYYDSVSRHISEGVKNAGGLPVILPISEAESVKAYVEMIDKLIISGGQNVLPSYYGEEKIIESDDYSLARDIFEFALVEEALKQNKPIFAICRGMQLVNVALGGTLNQSIDNHYQEPYIGFAHYLNVEKGSFLEGFISGDFKINSLHRQSVKLLAEGLIVSARDPRDGTVEAYESRTEQCIIGVQWHPELMLHQIENQTLFGYFVNET
ncbi:TPA: gamma-glutamyl-gamma-aminobutyrate hydrolase family protein [Streptococcus agalactiae]